MARNGKQNLENENSYCSMIITCFSSLLAHFLFTRGADACCLQTVTIRQIWLECVLFISILERPNNNWRVLLLTSWVILYLFFSLQAILHGNKSCDDFLDAVVSECQLELKETLEKNQFDCWRNSILFAAGLYQQLSEWNVTSLSLGSLIYSTMYWLAEEPQCLSPENVRF